MTDNKSFKTNKLIVQMNEIDNSNDNKLIVQMNEIDNSNDNKIVLIENKQPNNPNVDEPVTLTVSSKVEQNESSQKNIDDNDSNYDITTTIADHVVRNLDKNCIIYKFQSRPPYEGFILILIIVLIAILFLWWLNTKLKCSKMD